MELALATGRGPAILSDLDGLGPLVRDTDVVVFGRRDGNEAEANGSRRVEDTDIRMVDLDEVRAHGCADRARLSARHLCRPELSGFWMHLDADVVDDDLMPAVDYRIPGGLSWDELAETIDTHLASDRSRGLSVTIFNPDLDPDGTIARSFVDALARALVPA
jgi:arginase